MLDVPHEVVEHVSWLICARRRELHSRRRWLSCFHQALLTLVHLRMNQTLAQVAAGFGVSAATVGRYVAETVDLLTEHAPTLEAALRELPPEGFVILDGTLIATDAPYYEVKHRRHGMNMTVLVTPDGTQYGASPARRAWGRVLPCPVRSHPRPDLPQPPAGQCLQSAPTA